MLNTKKIIAKEGGWTYNKEVLRWNAHTEEATVSILYQKRHDILYILYLLYFKYHMVWKYL